MTWTGSNEMLSGISCSCSPSLISRDRFLCNRSRFLHLLVWKTCLTHVYINNMAKRTAIVTIHGKFRLKRITRHHDSATQLIATSILTVDCQFRGVPHPDREALRGRATLWSIVSLRTEIFSVSRLNCLCLYCFLRCHHMILSSSYCW